MPKVKKPRAPIFGTGLKKLYGCHLDPFLKMLINFTCPPIPLPRIMHKAKACADHNYNRH